MGLATDTTVHLSRRGGVLKVKELTFAIRASDSSWHPGLSERPLFPEIQTPNPKSDPILRAFALRNLVRRDGKRKWKGVVCGKER